MPIINVDVKNLEGCVFADLSKDKTMIAEISQKEDLHSNNQRDFNLPDRITAKRFLFKLIYGATAYGYYTDADFVPLGFSEKRWQEIIDAFYKKYSGGAAWHKQIIQEAQTTGRLTIPSGRYFPFSPIKKPDGNYARDKEGALKWPITQIKNYPVQGFGADLVMLARLEAKKLLDEAKLEAKLVGSIHDSIICDCSAEVVPQVGAILLTSVGSVPRLCKQIWNYDFSLPLTAECSFGPNKFDLEELVLDKQA